MHWIQCLIRVFITWRAGSFHFNCKLCIHMCSLLNIRSNYFVSVWVHTSAAVADATLITCLIGWAVKQKNILFSIADDGHFLKLKVTTFFFLLCCRWLMRSSTCAPIASLWTSSLGAMCYRASRTSQTVSSAAWPGRTFTCMPHRFTKSRRISHICSDSTLCH